MIRPDKRQRDRARNLRKNLTDAERHLWQELRGKQLGVKFRRQAPVGGYIADFLCHDAKLVIELDDRQHGEAVAYDEKRTAFIEEQGFRVLRFWNDQVFENMEGVLMMVSETLKPPQPHPHPKHPHPTLPRERGRALASGKTARPPIANILHRTSHGHTAHAHVTLTYDDRFLRRKVLVTAQGERFLVDLPHTTSLNHGDALELNDGRMVEVIAADEALLEITCDDPTRIAWHIGNRHTPCQIEPTRLLIQRDHVMHDMLSKLGATINEVCEAFTPEGGAYGHGRTHGHSH